MLGDRGVDDPLRAEFVEEALGDLVGALVLGDFLTHDEDVGVAAHLLRHGVTERLADGHDDHLGSGGDVPVGGERFARRGRHARRRGSHRGPRGGLGLVCCRLGRSLADIILAVDAEDGDRGVDLDVLRAFRDEKPCHGALVDRLDLHRRLVGLDLGDHVAGLHRVAFLLQPPGELAFLHGRREGRHQNVDGHWAVPVSSSLALLPARRLPKAVLSGVLSICDAAGTGDSFSPLPGSPATNPNGRPEASSA